MTSQQLKQVRQALRMNQTELAAKLGVEQSTVARWECGQGIPQAAQLALTTIVRESERPEAKDLLGQARPERPDLALSPLQKTRLKHQHCDLLSTAQSAEYLGVDRRTVQNLGKAGLLGESVIGKTFDGRQDRKIRSYRRSELDRFIEEDRHRKGRERRLYPA